MATRTQSRSRSAVRLEKAEEDPHERGLASPVRPEKSGPLSGTDLEARVLDDRPSPEPYADTLESNRDVHGAPSASRNACAS